MILRVVGTLAAAISFAAWAGAAVAQYAPSPYPGAYGAPPQDDDEFDDLPGVYPAPYETRPSAYPPEEPPAYDRRAAPGVAEPYRAERPVSGPYGERAPMSPVERGMGPTDEGRPGLRPPADLAGRPPADVAPGRGPALAALPPDDQPEEGELKELPPHLKRQLVDYPSREPAGTLVVDTANTHLYLVMGGGKAMRYGIGVGREGFTWAGRERVSRMTEWPDWHPPAQMIERQPYLPRFMAGGPGNPMGARALYLGKTLYRIHGTNQPSTIGSYVSSGCIRLLNDDIEDLYQRVTVGSQVVVLPGKPPASAAIEGTPPAAVR
jgi:lipoprotein-anchoring transpeptidase ErfK/SrfK